MKASDVMRTSIAAVKIPVTEGGLAVGLISRLELVLAVERKLSETEDGTAIAAAPTHQEAS